jgi:hypothetical protein
VSGEAQTYSPPRLMGTSAPQFTSVQSSASVTAKPSSGQPLLVRWNDITPDAQELLQKLTLSLTNTSLKSISRVTMRLVYRDDSGDVVKEWTTRRELDRPLKPRETIQLTQPAYFMPLVTKHTEIVVVELRFSDGSNWTPKSARFL